MLGPEQREGGMGTEAWFRGLLTNISDTVSLFGADGRLIFTTGADNEVLGHPRSFWRSGDPLEIVHPDDRRILEEGWSYAVEHPGEEVAGEVRMRTASGNWEHVAVTGLSLFDDPDVGAMVVTSRNVTPLRRAERLASHQAAVLEMVARGAPMDDVAAACIDLLGDNGVQGRASIFFLEGSRLELRAGAAPASLREWVRTQPRSPERSICDQAIATESVVIVPDARLAPLSEGLRAITDDEGIRSGWSVPIASIATGRPVGTLSLLGWVPHEPSAHERQVADVVCSLVAVAVEREQNVARLAHQALHDALTGLPNRTLLLDRTDRALARRSLVDRPVALLFCDVDRFKVINDSLGHNVGDQLLVGLAERLRAVAGPADTVARFGGDEFVVLLEDLEDGGAAVAVAEALAIALDQPFHLPGGKEVYLTVSVGVAVADDHETGDAWLRDADAAMYRAKEEGRNRLALFDTQMRDAAVARMQVEHDLHRAVDRGEVVVHYQPVIDLRKGRIVGAEALVRWLHPERGLLGPTDFIAVAEDIGAIDQLGRFVLELAIHEVRTLTPIDPHAFQLGVNVSARQLTDPAFDQTVAAVLDRTGWPAGSLLLELTETALIGFDGPVEPLLRLRELGVALAIDDFGTGYSSLARLGHLPVDQVKIDQTFVGAIDRPDDRQARIVDAVTAIADALDLRTSAEGVETQAQLDHLRRLRCDYAQGYLFSKPVPIDELGDLLAADPRW